MTAPRRCTLYAKWMDKHVFDSVLDGIQSSIYRATVNTVMLSVTLILVGLISDYVIAVGYNYGNSTFWRK